MQIGSKRFSILGSMPLSIDLRIAALKTPCKGTTCFIGHQRSWRDYHIHMHSLSIISVHDLEAVQMERERMARQGRQNSRRLNRSQLAVNSPNIGIGFARERLYLSSSLQT